MAEDVSADSSPVNIVWEENELENAHTEFCEAFTWAAQGRRENVSEKTCRLIARDVPVALEAVKMLLLNRADPVSLGRAFGEYFYNRRRKTRRVPETQVDLEQKTDGTQAPSLKVDNW